MGFVIPTTSVLALEKHGAIAGTASALLGTLQMLTGARGDGGGRRIHQRPPLADGQRHGGRRAHRRGAHVVHAGRAAAGCLCCELNRETPGAAPVVIDGLPQPQRWRAMLVIILGIAVAVLDGTIVNLALPGIARELQADASHAIWVVNAYQIATLVMLLPLASLGDLHRLPARVPGGHGAVRAGLARCHAAPTRSAR